MRKTYVINVHNMSLTKIEKDRFINHLQIDLLTEMEKTLLS